MQWPGDEHELIFDAGGVEEPKGGKQLTLEGAAGLGLFSHAGWRSYLCL